MCKVFGQHKDCDVAPLSSVYMRQKVKTPYSQPHSSLQFTVRQRHRLKPRDSAQRVGGAVALEVKLAGF